MNHSREGMIASEKLRWLDILILFGIALFFIGFYYSTYLYPGGSVVDPSSTSYSWLHNYWCDLTGVENIRLETNGARAIALPAILILCFSMGLFFIRFALTYGSGKLKKLLLISGPVTMALATLIFTELHNEMIIISSLVGLVTVYALMKILNRAAMPSFKYAAIGCGVLLVINNIIYYTRFGIYFLPVVQKLTFTFILVWIFTLTVRMMIKDGKCNSYHII